ncbi:MAG: NTP transferase domain-containing protein [Candidatus Delongbacteria bacterium]|nr:NTP transferase domain-containing protein [Candidatus Delongbacteria bacterium]MBN2834942.1 NTP transferase domain-containing protein [Candidatus Delongbacteria bacterium]
MLKVDLLILSAGYGKRLIPISEYVPKPLIKIAGVPNLFRIIENLQNYVNHIFINTHHLHDQIYSVLTKKFPKINIIHEDNILGTGGAIKNVIDKSDSDLLIVYNCDVSTDLDVIDLLDFHISNKNDVSLAVQSRKSSRPILFNTDMHFLGRKTLLTEGREFGFCGIHVVSKVKLLNNPIDEFSIIDFYCKIKDDIKITGFNIHHNFWIDIGTLRDLEYTENLMQKKACQYV